MNQDAFEQLHRARVMQFYAATFRGSQATFLSAATEAVPLLPSRRPTVRWSLDGYNSTALFLRLPSDGSAHVEPINLSFDMYIGKNWVTLSAHTSATAGHDLLHALTDRLSRLLVREA